MVRSTAGKEEAGVVLASFAEILVALLVIGDLTESLEETVTWNESHLSIKLVKRKVADLSGKTLDNLKLFKGVGTVNNNILGISCPQCLSTTWESEHGSVLVIVEFKFSQFFVEQVVQK